MWTLEGDNFETRSMNCVGEVLPWHQVRMEAGMWRSFTKVQRAKGRASGESGVHGLKDTEDKKWKVRARHTMWKLEKVTSVWRTAAYHRSITRERKLRWRKCRA